MPPPRIRRIKCDLSQPSCSKCQSTGRICDGYGDMPLETESGRSHNDVKNGADGDTIGGANRPETCCARHHGLISQNPRPFMVLPMTGSGQTEAMGFFEYISIKHLNEYRPSDSWRRSLMFFSQTVPSVRYAAIALALANQNYLHRGFSDQLHQPPSSKDWLSDSVALFYYNRAIQLLLKQENGDSEDTTAITLLVCYLFICFDHLAGNYAQAMKHLRGGVELSRNAQKAILDGNNAYDETKTSGTHALICQITRQIRRLDMQAVTFLVDWTPADIKDTAVSQLAHPNSAFQSLDQAADHLQSLIARVMSLRNNPGQQMLPLSVKNAVLEQLETWSTLFENMLQQHGSSSDSEETAYPLITLLRLQYTIVWTYLSSSGPGREMEYDNFLTQFQQCVALAGDFAAVHERYSGSLKPTFTPEIGMIPVLYIIGAKCRHPVVRREALGLLRRQPIREAVWDSVVVARVVERIMEIEEVGFEKWEMIQSMEQVPVWQRVETLSWAHVVVDGQSAGRVDINYTFCAREGSHIESFMM
ncbi:uncharacterized protein TRIREDRAFT_62484 [Trichoderma reesei QM6a]|uniref:Predicted protein n=2 Tax=Hypocrea jecorina TaxID=51453 RepID=G0RKH8_HYPJQ|nr:uncharacterized protein TRIREDRAFT_62484 [Trichoderma reesei QM6a]EGR48250.1 predicted protein [Trichoderma reesei QM6a]ETS07074.1 hypothetical protein M419DRAFT_69859 [Trichoderma reesei RUT C-30]